MKFVIVSVLVWLGYALLLVGYAAIRSVGDEALPIHDPARLEGSIFGTVPSSFLQAHLYAADRPWLDYAGFLLYSSWYFLPFSALLLIMVFERKRLMEFLAWIVCSSYLASVFYMLIPVEPPWMAGSASRILLERNFVHYTQLDNNPVAAFPSLHAGLPLVIGLFFLLRCKRTRGLGWIAVSLSVLIGFAVIYLGEHWLIDVLGGYALAGAIAYLFMSSRVRFALHRLPGDPLARIIAFNNSTSSFGAPAPLELEPPTELERAA